MNWLDNGEVLASIGEYLAEDIGRGDITTSSTVPPDVRGMGRFLAKEDLVICGLEVAEAVFLHLDGDISEIETTFSDGDEVGDGTVFGTLKGYADVLLTGERVALNLLQRMSGVATLTRQYVRAIEGTSADQFVVAVQWHPERHFDQDPVSQKLFRAFLAAAERYSQNST